MTPKIIRCKKREAFTDSFDATPLTTALVLRWDGRECVTNVPHLVTHHSPCGYQYGYSGSGPADLALDICQWYLEHAGVRFSDGITTCWDGSCYSAAWKLHQPFKFFFLANLDMLKNYSIPFSEIDTWMRMELAK